MGTLSFTVEERNLLNVNGNNEDQFKKKKKKYENFSNKFLNILW